MIVFLKNPAARLIVRKSPLEQSKTALGRGFGLGQGKGAGVRQNVYFLKIMVSSKKSTSIMDEWVLCILILAVVSMGWQVIAALFPLRDLRGGSRPKKAMICTVK